MNIPEELLYTKDHEWIRIEGDVATVGITEFAQGELGDVVFVQLPEVGSSTSQGEAFGTIEAVKAVADMYAPVTGSVSAVNDVLADNPETINNSPYEDGWIVKIKVSDLDSDKAHLLDASAYKDLTSA